LATGKISEGHARCLLSLEDSHQAQSAVLDSILKLGLSVRQTEELVKKMRGQKAARKPAPAQPPEITELEERLMNHLGTKVTLNYRKKGGSLVIHYYSDEELDAIISQILKDN
jgi:ParB family chromosome partitioning protein